MNAYIQDAILNEIDGLKEDEITKIDKDEFVDGVAEILMNDLEDPDRLSDFLDQILKEHTWDHRQEIMDLLQENGITLVE
jgi:hypothetical protein